MTLSENQVRHFYVLSTNKTSSTTTGEGDAAVTTVTYKPVKTLSAAGDFAVALTKGEDALFIQHYGKGGLTRSDLIPVANILYANATAPTDMEKSLKKATITLNSDINADGTADSTYVPKGTYIVRISIRNFVGMSDEDFYFKYGQVTSNGTLTLEDFYTKLAASLRKNLSREVTPLFNVTSSPSNVVITEVEQPWRLGVMARTQVDFTVELVTNDEAFDVERSGNVTTYDWGTVTMGVSSTKLTNGKDIADMEYFYMGERADLYRNIGWPLTMPTEYMVNPSSTYYVLDLHFAYVGDNECVQKSEKTITLVSTSKTNIDAVITAIEANSSIKVSKSANY